MLSLGLDIGCYAIKLSLFNKDFQTVEHKYIPHKGRIKPVLKDLIQALISNHAPHKIIWGAVTGSGAESLTETGVMESVNDIQAIVEGSLLIDRKIGSIIEIGGQSAKYITDFSRDSKSGIKISTNNSCSAGTGSFLEEQLSRLNLTLEEYSIYADRAQSIPRIAGRCSVFAKTDITHHQQWGTPVEDILLGLAYAVIRNYRGAVMKKLPRKTPILFAGGVARNKTIVKVLQEILKLKEEDLVVPDCSGNIGAMGAALVAIKNDIRINPSQVLEHLGQLREIIEKPSNEPELPRLASFGGNDSEGKHLCSPSPAAQIDSPCYLGVDVGSTSTNLVLCNEKDEIIAFRYLRTLGKPITAVSMGLNEFRREFGPRINIAGVGVTGSGRYMIAEIIGADTIKDEITAQAKAAVTIDRSIDTVFEIGGQDSKFIRLSDGVVTDFQMNKVCAAGTGSFLEEQANKFNLAAYDLGEIALFSNHPINLGERCTVFIETSIASHLSQGARIEDIASGLCYSIAKNYLNRVVGQKPIGRKISFQGGVAFNQGVVNAFRALTGKPVQVPPFFSVSGSYGAAILAREEIGGQETKFKGFEVKEPEQFERTQPKSMLLTDNAARFNQRVGRLIFEGYDDSLDATQKTVGIPRALFTFGMFSMFNAFFKELGFNVLLSDPSSEKTIRLGQEYSLDETCYPVKLINGHVAELVQKKVDYIFFPDLYTVEHPGSIARRDYGCPYMQLAFKIINQAMELETKGIELLAPTIAFSLGKEFMMKSFSGLGKRLQKSSEQTAQALQKGMEAFHLFEKRIEDNGRELIRGIKPDEMVFVLISKIYGVADPVLNMGIPGKLMDMGHKVMAFYDLPEEGALPEHPNMYWPFGQHILEPGKLIKQHPNLYAILLTHHGCGPDSVLTHYFREIMGDKPYLHLEVDEHSSDVGVITRVEAFVNSLSRVSLKKSDPVENYVNRVIPREVNLKTSLADLKKETTLYLPCLYPYSQIFQKMLVNQGLDARIIAVTDPASIDLGRKHTLTNEYLSLTALLGDVLKQLNGAGREDGASAFLIPQSEGAEVDGQYSRFLRTILDEKGFQGVDILAPFMEDAIFESPQTAGLICLGLLAGDVVLAAPASRRDERLNEIISLIKGDLLDIHALKKIAKEVRDDLRSVGPGKTIMALGEPFILYNDILNDSTFRRIEDRGHRVIYGPLSEYMWLLWRDFANQNAVEDERDDRYGLAGFKTDIRTIADNLAEAGPFAERVEDLIALADKTVGYYAGTNGRYRMAKRLCQPQTYDGIITVASTYENTGIALGVLGRGLENGKPALDMTFDGNKNENDKAKIDSFIHFL